MKMLRRVVLAMALACVTLMHGAEGDPREVENAEFKDEFGEDFEDRIAPSSETDQRLEFVLEHNVPSASAAFSQRGRVEIVLSSNTAKPTVSFLDVPILSDPEVEHLSTLLRDSKLYTIRTRSDPQDPTSPFVVTSIPMCMLASTRMREDLTFHLSDDGKLVAMEYLTPYGGPDVCDEVQRRPLHNVKLASTGTALQAQYGPAPPKIVSVKQKAAPAVVKNPIKAEGEDEQPAAENQSFLRRYWYVILPIAVFTLIGGGGGDAPAPAGGAGGPRRR